MDTSNLNLDQFKKFTDFRFDFGKLKTGYQNFRSKFQRPLLMPGFRIIIVLTVLAVVLPLVYRNTLVRAPLAGTLVGSYVFCGGKSLCADSRCVGESYRECRVCPSGTSRSVFKATCDENMYSGCKFDNNKCVDSGIINSLFK